MSTPPNKDGMAGRIRQHLLKNGLQTLQDIQDVLEEPNKRRVQDNVKALKQGGFIELRRDDVTGLPAYQLTPKGTARAKLDAATYNGKTPEQNRAASEAADQTATADEDADAMPPADAALLASANRMLHERLEGVAHVLRGCGLEALKNCDGSEDLQPKAAALAGAYQMALAEIDALDGYIAEIAKTLDVPRTILSIINATKAMQKVVESQDKIIKELKHDIKNHESAYRMLLEKNTKLMEDLTALRGHLNPTPAAATPITTTGRMALLLIDSQDMTEVEELDEQHAENAHQAAISKVNQGHATRAIVVRILGEAVRRVEWKQAA